MIFLLIFWWWRFGGFLHLVQFFLGIYNKGITEILGDSYC